MFMSDRDAIRTYRRAMCETLSMDYNPAARRAC